MWQKSTCLIGRRQKKNSVNDKIEWAIPFLFEFDGAVRFFLLFLDDTSHVHFMRIFDKGNEQFLAEQLAQSMNKNTE